MGQGARQRVKRKAVRASQTPRVVRREIPAGRTDHAAFFAALRPLDAYTYFHSMRLLRKRPLTVGEREHLGDNCTSLVIHRHGQWVKDGSGVHRQLNIYPFTEELQLVCPNRTACEFLAALDDRVPYSRDKLSKHDRHPPLIVYLEVALDMILPDEGTLHAAFSALKRCFVQRWNGKNETIEFDNGGMSTGRRWRGKYVTSYISKPSPVTGEIECLHTEYRVGSAPAVRAVGVASIGDLLTFDHVAFWRKHFLLSDVDLERLGRHFRSKNQRRQRGRPKRSADDRRTGQVVWRACGYDRSGSLCVQALIRNYCSGQFLKRIASDHLLPSASENALFC
jgi:hypothetical protein